MTLVPEGWAWMTGTDDDFQQFFAALMQTDDDASIESIDTIAATPALALVAAALRAKDMNDG